MKTNPDGSSVEIMNYEANQYDQHLSSINQILFEVLKMIGRVEYALRHRCRQVKIDWASYQYVITDYDGQNCCPISPELIADLYKYHGLDAVEEIFRSAIDTGTLELAKYKKEK